MKLVNSDIKAVCKRCGKSSKACDMVLDPVYKLMVCPFCVKERKDNELSAQKNSLREKESQRNQDKIRSKPAGWDEEDEYLDKVVKNKKPAIAIQKIDDERVSFACPKCNYKVIFNTIKRHPSSCPYCGVKFRV